MIATHLVTRPFSGAGAQRIPGEVVDARTWRNTLALVRGGRLVPAPVGAEVTKSECGRTFIDFDGRTSVEIARAAKVKPVRGRKATIGGDSDA